MPTYVSLPLPFLRSRKVLFGLALLIVFAILAISAPTLKDTWDKSRNTTVISSDYTPLDSPIGERTETNLVALDNGRVFQWAGRGAVNDGVIFDPTTDTFEKLPTPEDPGRAAASTIWTGEEVIVWGGTTGNQESQVEQGGVAYHPSKKQWRTISDAPVGLSHAPAQLVDGQVLIAGGESDTTQKEPTSLLYDIETDSWEMIPINVRIQTMFNFDGRIIGAGMRNDEAGSVPDWQLVEFDSENNIWEPLGLQLQSQRLLPFVVDDQVGVVSFGQGKDPIQVLGFLGGQWIVKKELPSSYADPSSFYFWADWTGDALLFSGNSAPVQYHPATETFGSFDQPVDISGPAVWNGDQLVALAPQSSTGWKLKPSET